MDWITLSVELVGIAILCVWVVIPCREFAVIFRRILPRAFRKVVPAAYQKPEPAPALVESRP